MIDDGAAEEDAPGLTRLRLTRSGRSWLQVLVVLTIAGCSAVPGAAQDVDGDPLEPVNRAIFSFNTTVDGLVLEPAARIYRGVIPSPVRDSIGNVLVNARTPVVLANDLLQGEWQRANTTFGRFMINTIVGLGGIIDVATWAGMPEAHSEDFGQTLAVYGVGGGPYIVLPLLGPSNVRDTAGRVVDFFFDPIALFAPDEAVFGRTAAEGVDFREQNLETIDELERTSLDFYAATRTLSTQLRTSEIRNGQPLPLEDIYDESIYDIEDLDDPAYTGEGTEETPQ
ncbi:MAG: VacJ family lipoprotein [Geminicoccaceae bacterium]|nr:VacJ family lipoprotein [Geminicoccaceae bacterium]